MDDFFTSAEMNMLTSDAKGLTLGQLDEQVLYHAEHEDGDKMTTSYRVGSDRQSLYVTTKVEPADGDELTARWVYDAAKASGTPPQ